MPVWALATSKFASWVGEGWMVGVVQELWRTRRTKEQKEEEQ